MASRKRPGWYQAKRATSGLSGGKWAHETLGILTLAFADSETLAAIEATWPDRRGEAGPFWEWPYIASVSSETFVLTDLVGTPLAVWASTPKAPLRLHIGLCYRLDYIEVNPDLVKQRFGVYAMTLVAARAIEHGAENIVLGSAPTALGFYERLGGVAGHVVGWKPPRGTVPVVLGRDRVRELGETANELREA